MERKARTMLLNYTGWKTRKDQAVGEVFFLDFSFDRTNQELSEPKQEKSRLAICSRIVKKWQRYKRQMSIC
jgi:hypothetical protein